MGMRVFLQADANGNLQICGFSILSFSHQILKMLGKHGPVVNAYTFLSCHFPYPQTIQFNSYSHCINIVVGSTYNLKMI